MVKIRTTDMSAKAKAKLYDNIWQYLDQTLSPCTNADKEEVKNMDRSPCCICSADKSFTSPYWIVHNMPASITFWTHPASFESMVLLKFGGKSNGQA